MAEVEGVIKFDLVFEKSSLDAIDVSELSGWRAVLKDMGLLGETPDRYDGYGFGNVSQRVGDGFIISGTQTGRLDAMTLDDYAVCESWDLPQNRVFATGNTKPSSESLSHAAVYDVQEEACCALHAHSPDIWNAAQALKIPVTSEEVPYGTPEMAAEVRRLITGMSLPGIFSMGGHEDGIFTFGKTLDEAGMLMVKALVEARLVLSGNDS